MIRELLHVEQRYRTASRRAGLYEALEDAIRRSFYDSEEDAISGPGGDIMHCGQGKNVFAAPHPMALSVSTRV